MVWKICGGSFHKVHLKNEGDNRTICGRPQENYDTVEGRYTLYQVNKLHGHSICKRCRLIATSKELLNG